MPDLMRADDDTREFVLDVLGDYHADLVNAEVTVDVLVDRKPVMLHGYPCAAVVRKTPYRQRVQGIADATITLDAATWKTLNEKERQSLVDHELTHLELVHDKEGQIKADNAGRPVLKMRLHDIQFGWFTSIARRHGTASYEVKQAREIKQEYGQLLFDWSDDMAGNRDTDEPPPFRVAK